MPATTQFSMPAPTAQPLLDWYDRHRRTLPWRAAPGTTADPYHVWLSEIMLQQTTVATVKSYFEAFITRWPRVTDLAAAPLDDVLTAWAGLGYYARARNLHKCAGIVATDFAGSFPNTEAVLLTLPGIGAYTAAAIAAIAFNQLAAPVDGNIERVLSRLYRVSTPLPKAKPEIKALTQALVPIDRPGDFAQALMDLGATVCTPKAPKCLMCPFQPACQAQAAGDQTTYPIKAPKKPKPTRRGLVFWTTDTLGQVLVRKRAERGLLGGMMEFPSTDWTEGDLIADASLAPVQTNWQAVPEMVTHTFTHFHLELTVWRGAAADPPQGIGRWIRPEDFDQIALPTVMKKVARHVLG